LQEAFPQAGEVEPERMAELRTLGDIVAFLGGAAAEAAPQAAPAATPPAPATPEPVITYPTAPGIGRAYAVLREVPAPDVLLGAYPPKPGALVIDDGSPLAKPVTAALRGSGWRVHLLTLPEVVSSAGGADSVRALRTWEWEELARAVEAIKAEAVRLDLAVQLAAAPAADWASATRRLTHALLAVKAVQPALVASATDGRSAYVALTALDGASGIAGVEGPSALLGGVNGLLKTLAIEAPALFCRTVDVGPALPEQQVGGLLLAELSDASAALRDIAYDVNASGIVRRTVTLADQPAPPRAPQPTVPALTRDDLLVVTGGARGVTAECLHAMASNWPCGLLLLGRTALTEEPAWASGLDGAALKGAIVKHVVAQGHKPTPRGVEKVFRDLTGQREVVANLARLTATGATATYLPVDISDQAGLAAALAPYAGKVTGVIHGAGVLADRLIVDKAPEDVERVLATKLTGLANVLAALRATAEAATAGGAVPLRHLVFFSSVAGFFGNRGQADYAMANEALNRVATSLKTGLPAARVTSVNWGAWDGGMVTAELRAMFEERGVLLVPVPTGVGIFAEQFTAAHAHDGVILAGPTGPLSTPDSAAPAVPAVTVDRSLTGLARQAVLADHAIGGAAVLPATMAIGALANLVETVAGAPVVQVDSFRVFKGVVFDGQAPATLRLAVTSTTGGTAAVRLSTVGPDGQARPAYGATVRVGEPTGRPAARTDLAALSGGRDASGLYGDGTLFHGPTLRGIRRVVAESADRLVLACQLPDHDVADGSYSGTYHSSVLADLLPQAALVWVRKFRGAASLPLEIGRLRYWEALPDGAEFLVAVEDATPNAAGVTCTITACATDGRVLARFDGVAVVIDAELDAKFLPAAA